MIDPHKEKYFPLYWAMAYAAARQSTAQRLKVGAVLVLPTGMISPGWNGMPAGFENECEYAPEDAMGYDTWTTKPEVIHAERNAIDKMTRQGIPTAGSLLFVTHSPCFECAKAIHGLGLKAIYYDSLYRCDGGLRLLERAGVAVQKR